MDNKQTETNTRQAFLDIPHNVMFEDVKKIWYALDIVEKIILNDAILVIMDPRPST